MPIFFLKSLLSIVIAVQAIIAMFTMLEVIGRSERSYSLERLEKLKRIHKANGALYLLLFIFIAYFCLRFIAETKEELTPRGAFHSIFALTIIILLMLKISFVERYRQFYSQAKTIGFLMALLTLGMVAISGGYYLLVTEFNTKPFKKVETQNNKIETAKIIVRTDPESIKKGKELYDSKCYFCHDAHGTEWEVGPGHKGILKNPLLPVSKKPATPENIENQLRHPYKNMPSFAYLPENDVLNIIAYLNTL